MASLSISNRKEEWLFLASQILEARWDLWRTRTYHLILALSRSSKSKFVTYLPVLFRAFKVVAYRFHYFFPGIYVFLDLRR